MFQKIGLIFFLVILWSCAHKTAQIESTPADPRVSSDGKTIIRYEYKEGELTALCNQAIEALQKGFVTWRNQNSAPHSKILLDFDRRLAVFSDQFSPMAFMGSVSTVEKIREEASKCEEHAGVAFNEVYTNRENYRLLKGVQTADFEEQRLLKEILFYFEMNGMSLNEADLKKFKALKDRLSQLSVQFGQNLNNDTSSILFTEAELKGANSDFLARLKKNDSGQFIVTTKSPDYVQVMENVSVSETRRKMLFAYNNRQAEVNTGLLQEATRLREEMARLMGYSNYADYALREKMAGTSKEVFKFLNGLRDRLAAKNRKDLGALSDFKKKELKDSSPLATWDILYLANQLKIKKYNVDEEVVREFFPSEVVVNQTLSIYSELLGVTFRKIEGASVWAKQVELYEVSDKITNQPMAYFYADLIPREGKYGHAAAFPLISGRQIGEGTASYYQKPVAAIVANFSPAAPGKPVLLSHGEVETFFHEFGHIMHQILTKVKFASLSGTNVKGDYVEAPSQMLENWVWKSEILKRMSQHYLNPKKQIPNELITRLQNIRRFNSGIQFTRQLVFGFFDMNIHTNSKLNVTDEFAKVHFELTGLKAQDGSHFPATFGHMMGGYSAGYYGYLWSKVYAEDMFSVFEKEGILNPKVGMKYRKYILESGNSKDPLELIEGFLGRKSNNNAFFKSLGL